MSIRFACETCRRVYELPDDAAGRQAKCECGQMLLVPAASTYTGRTRLHGDEPSAAPEPPAEPPSTPPPLPEVVSPPEASVPPPLPDEAFGAPAASDGPTTPLPELANEPPSQPPAAPPLDPPPSEPFSQQPRRNLTRGRRHERSMSFAAVLLAFFDLRLRSYLTPYLLRFLWGLTLITVGCFFLISACLIVFEVSLLEVLFGRPRLPPGLGLPQPSQPGGGLPPAVRDLLGKVIRLGSLIYCCVVGLVMVRVSLELGIVVFNIADTLERIRARLLREDA